MSNIIWFAGVVIFGVIEAATAQLVSIWLAGGAVCALIASLCGANGTTQTVIFRIRAFIATMTGTSMSARLRINHDKGD